MCPRSFLKKYLRAMAEFLTGLLGCLQFHDNPREKIHCLEMMSGSHASECSDIFLKMLRLQTVLKNLKSRVPNKI